ncbi:hypothetical protein ACN08N_25670 (plasmid) [Photobacterium leiognathi subsp. mandapamensis]|uniref:hypothetical protein n=2 Tax=Photobacterium leiognathi TaxID=553611 RepID=UPI003AF3CC29
MKTLSQWMFTTADQIAFLEQWQSSDEYGLTTRQFCESLIENGTSATKQIGTAGIDAPARGQVFTDVLVGWLPELVIATITVADNAGDRQLGIQAAIRQLQGGQNIIGRLARVLAFPFVLSIGVGGLGLYVSNEVLKVMPNSTFGLGAQINQVVSAWGTLFAIACVTLLMLTAIALPRLSGAIRELLDHLPIFSLYKHATAGALMETVGNLLSCGMKLDDALLAVEQHSQPFMRSHVVKMRERNIGQDNLGEIFDTGLLIPFELSALKVLGEHVDYSVLLMKSAKAHQKVVERSIARMMAVLPQVGVLIAIILLGALIGTSVMQLLNAVQ